jgi:quercetin dioxygenase-like cupin family protein
MNVRIPLIVSVISIALPAAGAAQSTSIYVRHDKVDAALAQGGALISTPDVRVAGAHREKAGALDPQKDTSILYVTEGEAMIVAGGQPRRLTKGDVVVIPAGTPQSFKEVSRPVSYYLVTVPVLEPGGVSTVTFVDREKVAATLKKAGPLADGPNLKVSGGYRTGPYAPADYRPDVEVHSSEADLFYVIDGDATLITGGTVVGGKVTAPGQIRGSRIEGGKMNHLSKGDVMWVPAGVPHWFPQIPRPLSYFLVKVLQQPDSKP